MTNGRFERFAPLAGAIFFVFAILGALTMGDTPDFVDEPAKIAAHYEEDDGKILAADTLYLLGVVFLVWFVGSLRTVLRRAEALDGRLSATALAAGAAGAALMFAAAATDAAAALRVMEHDEIDPQVASVFYDLSSVLFGLAAPMAFAVMLFATALVTLRYAALPVWHAWLSILLAIPMLVPPISWLAMIVFIFWVLATSVLLYLGAGRPTAAGTAAVPPPTA